MKKLGAMAFGILIAGFFITSPRPTLAQEGRHREEGLRRDEDRHENEDRRKADREREEARRAEIQRLRKDLEKNRHKLDYDLHHGASAKVIARDRKAIQTDLDALKADH